MTHETLSKAEAEARRFLAACSEMRHKSTRHDYIDQDKHPGFFCTWPPKERGAVRRASMDLTRALAELRRSN